MQKVVINISDSTYEKLRFEAILEKKNIQQVLVDRVFYKPFHRDVEDSFQSLMDKEIEKIIKE